MQFSIKSKFIIIIFIFLPFAHSLTGDISIPPDSIKLQDSRIQINYKIIDQEVVTVINFKMFGYFGLMYNPEYTMPGGDFYIVQIPDGINLETKDSHTETGKFKPLPDTIDDVTLLGSDTDLKTYIKLKLKRKLNTGDSQDIVLSQGLKLNHCYAYSNGSLIQKRHLKPQKNCFPIIFGTKRSAIDLISGGVEYPYTVYIHGVLMTIAWCLLADIAVILVFIRKFKYNILLHGIIFTIVILISIANISYQLYKKSNKIEGLANSHYIIGVLILIWLILQYFIGIACKMLQEDLIHPRTQIVLKNIHKYSGYVLMFLCKINIIIGWILWNSNIGYILVAVQIFVFSLFLITNLFTTKSISNTIVPPSKTFSSLKEIQSDQLKQLLKKPYNSPQLSSYNYIIFNNQVFPIQQTGVHPGGQYIFNKVNRREVDRFLYGMYFIQEFPDLAPVLHSANCLSIISPPYQQIIQKKLYTITNSDFIIQQCQEIADSVYLIYLKPNESNSLIYQQLSNLDFIGQYFTVEGFGKHRLYTCVASQRKQNKALMNQILRNMGLQHQHYNFVTTIELLPLIIKHYKVNGTFTNNLFSNQDKILNSYIKISGLNGLGLRLQNVAPGKVILFAGGTGLFPYLDLLDLIFKKIASQKYKFVENEILKAQKLLLKHEFELICSVAHTDDLIIPLQLSYMSRLNHPQFKMKLRLGRNTNNLFDHCLINNNLFDHCLINLRFNNSFIKDYILPQINQISMIYICGPPKMYKELIQGLKENFIPSTKIFIV